jgi:prepilin-type N-terminal cleavage/methylation domain-containing protein
MMRTWEQRIVHIMHNMRIGMKSKYFSRFLRGSRGFTLSELAVVLVVVGILASIAVPAYLGSRNESFDKAAQGSIDVVLRAAKIHYQTYGDFSEGSSTQCGDSAVLAADLQKLEPGIDIISGTVASNNPREVSVQAVNTWNSGNESLGCQAIYAVALSASGSCWAARFTVEGKYLAAGSVSPIVLANETNTNNSEIVPLANTPVNALAYGLLKPETSGANGTDVNGLAQIAAACKAKTHSTGVVTVSGSYIAPSQFYSTWRDVVPGGTPTNEAGPGFSLSSSSESVVQNAAMTGYTITPTGTPIVSFSISPAAPTGTTFSTTTGLLSGTPTTVQIATVYTITSTNTIGTATATFTLTVTVAAPGTPIVEVIPSNTQAFVVVSAGTGGTPSSYTVSASPQVSGVTRTCTVTGSSGECIVAGLTNGVAYTFTATASNAVSTSTASTASASVTPDVSCAEGGVCTSRDSTGPGGGTVFYYSATAFTSTGSACGTDCHYLEAASTSGTAAWTDITRAFSGTANHNSLITGADGAAIGTGYQNTLDIIAQSGNEGEASAAGLARAYRGPSNLSDWFLPSYYELNEMCKYAKGLGQAPGNTLCSGRGDPISGFDRVMYRSSTEGDKDFSLTVDFYWGGGHSFLKQYSIWVRPVRAF